MKKNDKTMKDKAVNFLRNRKAVLGLLILAALGAALFELFIVCLIAQLILLLCFVRMPRSFGSLVSRSVMALLIFYSLWQLAAAVQFFILPSTDFRALAVVNLILVALTAWLLPTKSPSTSIISSRDIWAIIGVLIFVLPIGLLGLFGPVESLAKIGSIQGVDGLTHFKIITEAGNWQSFKYEPGFYYPSGFHIATAFIQDALGVTPLNLSWGQTVRLFIMQYAVFGAVMLYVLIRFCFGLLEGISKKRTQVARYAYISSALVIGVGVTCLYFSSFIYHGFLNYFYICAALVAGMIYVVDRQYFKDSSENQVANIGMFLLLSLGASMSWPLWVPVIYLTATALVLRLGFTRPFPFGRLGVLLLLSALHLIPIYFQLAFSVGDSTQGINLTGGLRVFHYGALLLGMLGLAGLTWRWLVKKDETSQLAVTTMLPVLILVIATASMQYFMIGEVRYYAIKTSLYFEILGVILAAATTGVLLNEYVSDWRDRLVIAPAAIVLSLAMIVMFLSLSGNPFLDSRQLLRNISDEPSPAFFAEDVKKLTSIGVDGNMTSDSVISLHVSDSGVFYSHMQAFYWASVMEFDGSPKSRDGLLYCSSDIYRNLFVQDFSDRAQQQLISKTKECIQLAEKDKHPYYIVTDEKSAPTIRAVFGDKVRVI